MLSYRKVGNWHVGGGFRLILNICTELQYRCFSLGEERRVRRTILTIGQSVQFSPLTNCSISINFPPLIILLKIHCSLRLFTSTNRAIPAWRKKREQTTQIFIATRRVSIRCKRQENGGYPLPKKQKWQNKLGNGQETFFSCGGSRNLTFLVKTHIHFIC